MTRRNDDSFGITGGRLLTGLMMSRTMAVSDLLGLLLLAFHLLTHLQVAIKLILFHAASVLFPPCAPLHSPQWGVADLHPFGV